MAATNTKTKKSHIYSNERTAGGSGVRAAKQSDEAQLRRMVMACLLWEDIAYMDGISVVEEIKKLVHKLPAGVVAKIAIDARQDQKLRHVPLFLCRELARHEDKSHVANALHNCIRRPDELCEFVAMFLKDGGTKTLTRQVKYGLASAFQKFDEYQLSKWDRDGKAVKLRDVLFLCHAKPKDNQQKETWTKLINGTLPPADTWEVGLSAAKSPEDKKAVWKRLIKDNMLGPFALLKNLRNMEEVGVDWKVISGALKSANPQILLPIDFMRAAVAAPKYIRELEELMFKCANEYPKLEGKTLFVLDVSGSMSQGLSNKTQFNRKDAGAAMAILAMEMCEHCVIYATAGSDSVRQHKTKAIKPVRGFGIADSINDACHELGGGGIFTRQCLEYLKDKEKDVDRIIIFSDSQDCDVATSKKPQPFGKYNYIVDVSSHKNGVNYKGVWTAEISGWSESFLRFIAACESQNLQG